jgi:hypothetical protein
VLLDKDVSWVEGARSQLASTTERR